MKRGIRNNNPLNIRHSPSRWQGMAVEQTDPSFVQFQSMAYGYRAACKLLHSYWQRFRKEGKPFTVRTIISRWAPPEDNNDTEGYIRSVTLLSGLGGNESIPRPRRYEMFMELEKTARLLAAMTCVECGIPMEEVDMEAIWEGYDLAFDNNRKAILIKEQEALRALDEYWDWSPEAYG